MTSTAMLTRRIGKYTETVVLESATAVALSLAAVFCSFVMFVSGKVTSVASGIAFLFSVALFIMGQMGSGIAWVVMAFLLSPVGLPALTEWIAGALDNAGYTLRSFIFS